MGAGERRGFERVHIASLVAPPAAGVLIQLVGGPATLIAIAAVFGLAAVAMLRVPEPDVATASTGHLLADARDGLLYVWHNDALRSLAFSISVSNMSFGAIQIAVPVLVLDRLGGSPAAVGAIWALMGAAGMVSSFAIGRLDTRGLERPLIVWPLAGMILAFALLLPAEGVWLVLVAAVLVGLLDGPVSIGMMTLRQRRTDPAWMGRAFAVSMSLNMLGEPFGSAIGGLLVERSLDIAILFGIAASAAAALIAWLTLERRRAPVPRDVPVADSPGR